MDLPKWNDYFLTFEARKLPELPNLGCEGAIYAPGLACSCCGTSLKLGFVVKAGLNYDIFGADCLRNDDVEKWRSMVNRSRHFLMLDHFYRCETLKPVERKFFKALSLLVQVFPDRDFPRAMFNRILNTQPLSEPQIAAIEKMAAVNGGVEKLLRQRDLIRRLCLLYLCQPFEANLSMDWAKVESLLYGSKYQALTASQERLVYALEDAHRPARYQLTEKVINQWPFALGKVTWNL